MHNINFPVPQEYCGLKRYRLEDHSEKITVLMIPLKSSREHVYMVWTSPRGILFQTVIHIEGANDLVHSRSWDVSRWEDDPANARKSA